MSEAEKPTFYTKLRRIRTFVSLADAARYFCLWLMGALLGTWAHFVGDFVLRWRMATRFTVTACVIVGILIGFGRIFLRRLFARPDIRQIALQIERKHRWRGMLVSGAEFVQQPPQSSELAARLFRQLDERVQELGAGLLLRWRDLLGPLALLIVFTALTVTSIQVFPETAEAWWQRLRRTDAVYPASVRIVRTIPGHARQLIDEPIILTAEAQGELPETATLEYVYRGQLYRVPVLRSGTHYTCRLEPVVDSFTYQFVIADAETPSYRIEIIPHLELDHVQLVLTPPGYTGQPQRTETASYVEVPEGTKLHLSGTASRPVVQITRIALSDPGSEVKQTVDLPDASKLFELEWILAQTETWRLAAIDRYGFQNTTSIQYEIRVLEDKPPRTWIERPDQHMEVTSEARIPLTCHVEDDYAVQKWWLEYEVRSDPLHVGRSGTLTLPMSGSNQQSTIRGWALDLSTLHLSVGDVLRYWVVAEDNHEPEPQTGQSQEYEIRVLSRLESLAILSRKQATVQKKLEEIADEQARLLDVTRKLQQ